MSCCRTQLSPTATLITTTAASKLQCDDRGCQVRSSNYFAPPAVGTSFIAVAVASAVSDTDERSSITLSAILDDLQSMSVVRRRKRDLVLAEIAAWKAQVAAFFDQQPENASSPAPAAAASSNSSSTSSPSDRTSYSSASSTPLSPPATAPHVPAPSSANTAAPYPTPSSTSPPLHIRVLTRRSNRKLAEELFLPLDCPASALTDPCMRTAHSAVVTSASAVSGSTDARAAPVASQASGAQTSNASNPVSNPSQSGSGENANGDDGNSNRRSPASALDSSAHLVESDNEKSEEEESWNEGYKSWKARRRHWVSPPVNSMPQSSSSAAIPPNPVHQLKPEYYPKIYRMLVHEGRRLREPINLSDATKILVSGWQSSGQWPPQPSAPDPLVARRRR
ncbi:uncharacterized protein V2V93DRAFT_365810 [Kockiozyma suomiensis]|uniref:uncharacterized protein n=1 Tax=Kockiozyma suomiensis TaxID=1337062 RepID=UPI0033442179